MCSHFKAYMAESIFYLQIYYFKYIHYYSSFFKLHIKKEIYLALSLDGTNAHVLF